MKKIYINKMYELKIENRDFFFSESKKRKILYPFLKFKYTRSIAEQMCPYSYNDINLQNDYFVDDKIAIYTGIYGGYDSIYEPKTIPDNCDFFCFSDDVIKSDTWINCKYNFPEGNKLFTNFEKNRFIKIHPHLLFSDYKYSIYIDGNIEMITDFTEYITSMNDYGIKMHNHYNRNCAYKEIKECIKQKKCSVKELENYQNKLLVENFPHEYGLLEAPIIVREHNKTTCIELMNQWWDEYYNNIKRDQLALIYILWKNKIKPIEINQLGRDIHSNYSFIQHTHSK